MNLHAIQIDIMNQSGVKPRINGRCDLREDEPSDHSMSRTYHDRHIKYLKIHTNAH